MGRYQIRTPENLVIDDVILEMAGKSWDALKHCMNVESPPGKKDFRKFQVSVRDAFLPHVRTFRLCGLSNICLDETVQAPLAEDRKDVDVNPNDLVYHVFLREAPEEFMDSLTQQVFPNVEQWILKGREKSAKDAIRTTFTEVLSHYLYYNEVCGKAELCIYSSSAPVPPWGPEEWKH